MGEERLRDLFGKLGEEIYRYPCGKDDRPVEPVREHKSVGNEVTLERDIRDLGEMERILETLALQVEQRLAELGIAGKTLTLKLRWSTFELVTRTGSCPQGFQSAQEMLPVLRALLAGLMDGTRAVRLLGVIVSRLFFQISCVTQDSSSHLPSGKKTCNHSLGNYCHAREKEQIYTRGTEECFRLLLIGEDGTFLAPNQQPNEISSDTISTIIVINVINFTT